MRARIQDLTYDLSKFFSNVMNSKNLALVKEDFVHVYVPSAKPVLNITFFSGKEIVRYCMSIIQRGGRRVLGKVRSVKDSSYTEIDSESKDEGNIA